MEQFIKTIADALPALIALISAYVYMREEAAKMQERMKANKEATDHKIDNIQSQLEDAKQGVADVKGDLNAHKDKIDEKFDKILDKIDGLRTYMHEAQVDSAKGG